MADIRITDLVDEKVFEDLNRLSEDIKTLKQQYVEAASALAQGLNMKITTSDDLEKFNQLVAASASKAQTVTEQLNATIDKQRVIVGQTTNTISRELAEIEKENKTKREAFEQDKSAIDIAERILGSRQNNIIRLAELQTRLKETKEAEKALDDQVKIGTISEQEALSKRASLIDQQREYKAAIKDLNLVLTNQEKQMQASEGSYQKLSLQLEFLKKAYKSLNDAEKESDIGKQLGEEIGNLDAHLKDLAADMGEFQRNTGNYAIANQNVKTELRELVQEIAMLTLQYRNMSEDEKKSAQGQELEQKMQQMTQRASELKDAVADVNREIKAGASDTKNMSTITEGINLLVSGVGGLTAASHALGIGEKDLIKIQTTLQASLAASNALTKAQNVLQEESNLMQGVARVQQMAHAAAIRMKTVAEGEGIVVTKAATVAQAAFNAVANMNPYVLLATGIGLLVAAAFTLTKATKKETEEQKAAREEMEKSRQEYEEMMDVENRLTEAREKGIDSCSDEIAKLNLLYSAATDATRSMNERMIAVKKLQELYPAYFGNLKNEAVLVGNAIDVYNNLTEAIIKKAVYQAYEEELTEYARKYKDSMESMKDALEKLRKYEFGDKVQKGLQEEERQRAEYGRRIKSIEEHEIDEKDKRDREQAQKDRAILEQRVAEAKKQAEDYQKAMNEIEKSIDVGSLLSSFSGSGDGGNKPTKSDKEETVKTYDEIKEVILEYTQEIIADKIALTKEGSKEEYDLTLKYIYAEQELREMAILKSYEKVKEELEKSHKEKVITDEQYTEKLKELEDARVEQVILADRKAEEAREEAMQKYSESYITSMQENYAKEQKERELSLVKEITSITDLRASQLISEEEYQQRLADAKMRFAAETAQKEIEMLEKVLEAEELTADRRAEVAGRLAEIKADLAKQVADAQLKSTKASEKQEQEAQKEREKNFNKYVRSVQQMVGKLNGLVSAIYDGQIQKIDEQQEEAEKAHDAEIERIQNLEETGAISKEEAEARKRAAEERSAKKQEELDKKKQELQYKQAVWEKATSIAQAGIATALAITQALPNLILAALVGAMGAMEIATIIATPIKTYAKGTKDKEGHPGGYALVGDGGKKEAVVYENKMWITPDKPTIINLPKGAIVYPDADHIPEPVFNAGPTVVNMPKDALVYPKSDTVQASFVAPDIQNTIGGAKVSVIYPEAVKPQQPVLMTEPPRERDNKPIVIVSHDSKKLERGVAQTNMLFRQSILMQKRLAYDAAFANYKARRL